MINGATIESFKSRNDWDNETYCLPTLIQEEHTNLLKGISISRISVNINHSMFANDTIFFFQTDKTCNNNKIHIGLVFPTIKASCQFQQIRNIVHPSTWFTIKYIFGAYVAEHTGKYLDLSTLWPI